jgi:hypothetical protein
MPSRTQDGRHKCVSQNSCRPGRPVMLDNRVGFIHRFCPCSSRPIGQML